MTRILLDEGVPHQLARALRQRGADAKAFPNEWKQLSNGALLDRVEQEKFAVLITCDKNMPSQQNLASRGIAVLVLATNRRDAVLLQADRIAGVAPTLEPGLSYDLSAAGELSPRFRR